MGVGWLTPQPPLLPACLFFVPELPAEFDLIVLGAGSAGLGLSLFMARIKLRVPLIDQTLEGP